MQSNIIEATTANFDGEVMRSEVPVLVDFWAAWCPPCRMLKPELEAMAPAFDGRAKFAFVDVDSQPGLASAFEVRGIPAVFIVKNGEVVDQWTGYAPRASVEARLAKHV